MDPHSKALSSLKDQGQIAAARVSQEIIEWKATFSLRWYHQFVQDDIKRLSYVFSLLFELTEFPDSNVTIASFNAIGALLVSISPFRSDELIKAFKSTLTGLAVSPNTSCAVIATFVFLSHQVSEHNISDFIDSTPIIHHFGADLRQFIHHIPNLIEQMDRLNLDFHQALLRSLVSSFGRNPVGAFIDSTMLLIRKYPEKLISDLLEFVESNNLDATLLAVGGPILNNKAFAKFLSPQKKVNLGEIVRKKTNMETSKVLVTYFSATGTTAKVARDIADVSGGELFEIMPQNPYTDADLNWNNKQSRSSIEMGDATSRPALRNKKENISDYDIIFIGYPIWWNLAPRIINTFIEEHDLNGKVIIPFATSGGSGISNSVSALKKAYPSLNWKEGKLLNRANRNVIREWTVQFQ